MTERELQKAVIQLAETTGWMVYHVQNVKGHLRAKTSVGFPDLIMIRDGQLVVAELKSEKGKLSQEQIHWLTSFNWLDKNCRVFVWRPEQWLNGDIEEVLK